jgi:cyclopropane fatty-acyl-phospholipid synthase-like methyltransferase
VLLACLAITLAGCAVTADAPRVTQTLDAPYVPTADEAVAEMLRGANVGPNDVDYDLGSGDGRIVIAAARDFGARAVGIELDPALVQQSRDRALAAGVADRVTFIWKDIFEADLSPATVVTVYLFPEVNTRLLPKFRRELRPGTRVVSHQYPIGDWAPDRSVLFRGPVRNHTILYWTVRP